MSITRLYRLRADTDWGGERDMASNPDLAFKSALNALISVEIGKDCILKYIEGEEIKYQENNELSKSEKKVFELLDILTQESKDLLANHPAINCNEIDFIELQSAVQKYCYECWILFNPLDQYVRALRENIREDALKNISDIKAKIVTG